MVLIPVRFLHYLLFVAVYEEPGWRGFLLPRLQSRFSPLMARICHWILRALAAGPCPASFSNEAPPYWSFQSS